MLREVFNPQNYYWNPYAAPMFVSGILVFLEGLLIYSKNRNKLANKTGFLWFILVSVWLLGAGMCQIGK